MKRLNLSFFAMGAVALAGIAAAYFVVNRGYHWLPEPLVKLVRETELVENAEAKRCSECHRDIYESWKKSRHSRAWVSENYVKDSEDRTKEKCLPCHIPQAVRAGTKPDPRLWNRDDGIYCVPCHVAGKEMNGPYELFSPPHPTRENPDYRKSKFCGACHQKTFKEWESAGTEKTCQSCHMPRSAGRLTQKFPLSWLHSPKQVGDHGFPHGEIGADDLAMSAEFSGGSLVVALTNRAIPHLVPTADNGDPRLHLHAILYDASGNEVEKYKEILAPQQDTALPYGKKVEFKFPLAEPARRAEIALQYQPAWSKERSLVRKAERLRE